MGPKKLEKKVLGKDELRRLMKTQKTTLKGKTKKIDSPLAKYNNIGQLLCVLCGTVVKSEILWNAHIQGRTHKENLADAKLQKDTLQMPAPPPKIKLGSKTSDSKKGLPSAIGKKQKEGTQKISGLGLGEYSSSEDEEDDASSLPAAPPASSSSGSKVGDLPPDFFDSGVQPSSTEADEAEGDKTMANKLPEGFFDDAKLDAKVRKVEYVDKQEEEWEMFQRAMKEETNVSEAIMAEEDDEINAERNILEIDEQLHRWSKVDNLLKQKEELMSQAQSQKDEDADKEDDTDEQQEFDEFLDWRTKKAWK